MSYSSIKGRLLGYDTRHRGVLANIGGFNETVTSCTSATTATAIPHFGLTLITAATTSSYNMNPPLNPAGGTIKRIFNTSTSTSTGARTVISTGVTFQTTTSSTYDRFSWIAAGGSIELISVSTARWVVTDIKGATLA